MAESAVSSVVLRLGVLLLMEEAQFLRGVTDQILTIKNEMTRMQCFLKDADTRQDESALGRNWVSEIRELAYDVEDAIETYILKEKHASSFNPKKYIRLHTIGREIQRLQSKILDIRSSVETYDFIRTRQGEGSSSTTEMQQLLRHSYPHYDDDDVVGMQDDIQILVGNLINREGPYLVSLSGMGGLGKTTLAKKVYNHDDVKRHFDCCVWSFISQQFHVRTILRGIIRKVGNPNAIIGLETLSDGELTLKLFNLLEGKCYLVVLDDIWSKEAWDVLKPAFPRGNMGCKIMFTTRNKEVAVYADPSGFHREPLYLTEKQSWELFCKKAFLWKNVASSSASRSSSSFSSFPPMEDMEKKEELGKDMIKKCGGLPLAVVALGGLLAMKESIHEWKMVAEDIGRYLNNAQQHIEQRSVSWILSLSYHDLPFYLKPCFLYLGLYPEDTEVHRKELIQMWIAEGFVQHNGQGTTNEKIGEQYLVELINRSMVQVGERSARGKVKTCRLHDLMRELCLRKAKEENFLCTFDGGSQLGDSYSYYSPSYSSSSSSTSGVASTPNYQRMRRHAIHFTCDRYVSMPEHTTSPHLRVFSLWRPLDLDESIVTLKFCCKKFNFLRVLVLEDIMIDSLPRSIEKLIHLRYLRLISRELYPIKVPPSIGNLWSLQFLTLSGIEELPNVLWKMEQLIYCSVRSSTCMYESYESQTLQADGVQKNLWTLELPAPKSKVLPPENVLSTLTNLRKLFLYDVYGYDCKFLHKFSISRLDLLQCLSLEFESILVYFDWSPLSHCRSLWKLSLSGGILLELPKLEKFPPNLAKFSFKMPGLREDPIRTLEMLPNLEGLRLGNHWEKEQVTKYYFSEKGFRRLQYLRLGETPSLMELEVEMGALPCLLHLQIKNCRSLKMLPEGLRFITSLKKLEVIDMPDEFNERLRENGVDWHKIQHIPSIIIQ